MRDAELCVHSDTQAFCSSKALLLSAESEQAESGGFISEGDTKEPLKRDKDNTQAQGPGISSDRNSVVHIVDKYLPGQHEAEGQVIL